MDTTDQRDEAELVERYRQGDQQAAKALFDQTVGRLLRIVKGRMPQELRPRMDADDVVPSAYRSFFRIARHGDVKLQESGDLWRLLVGIALNKLRLRTRFHYQERRSPRRERRALPAGLYSQGVDYRVPEEETMLIDELNWLTQQLSWTHQQILQRLLEGESVAAVSQKVQRTERTVRRVLEQAVHTLKARLKSLEQPDPAT